MTREEIQATEALLQQEAALQRDERSLDYED